MISIETILCVDDDLDFLDQITMQLEAAGYKTITGTSQKEAEELIQNEKFDMVISDLMMENADAGFSIAYHVKKKYPDTPVVIVTSVTKETGLKFGVTSEKERSWIKADAMLNKPVRFEELKKVISKLSE